MAHLTNPTWAPLHFEHSACYSDSLLLNKQTVFSLPPWSFRCCPAPSPSISPCAEENRFITDPLKSHTFGYLLAFAPAQVLTLEVPALSSTIPRATVHLRGSEGLIMILHVQVLTLELHACSPPSVSTCQRQEGGSRGDKRLSVDTAIR